MKNSLKVFIVFVMIFSMMSASLADENYEVLETKFANDLYKIWTISFNEALDPKSVSSATVFVKNAFNRVIDVSVSLSADGKSITVTPSELYVPGFDYELHINGVASIHNEVLSPAMKMPFVIEQVKEERSRLVKSSDSSSLPSSNQQQTEQSKNSTPNNSPFNNNSSTRTNGNQSTTNQPSTNQPTTNSGQQQAEKKPIHLTNIKVEVNPLVSNVTVKASKFVAVVRIDGKQMHYQGNNLYELTIPGLKSGDSIKVEAFATYERNSSLEQINHKVK